RLREKMLGAELHGAYRGLDVALAREQNDRRALRAQALEHIEAAHVGEVQIKDHHVGAQSLERRHAPFSGVLPRHLVAQALEVVTYRPHHIGVIVDEEYGLSHGGLRSPRGRPAASAPRTGCPPWARHRAASAAPRRRVPRPAPRGRGRTTATASRCAAGALARETPRGSRSSPPPGAPARRATRRRGRPRRAGAETVGPARRSSPPGPGRLAARGPRRR